MRKKATNKSPLPLPSPASKSIILLRNKTSNKEKCPNFSAFRSSPQQKTLSSIPDLKDMASSRIHDLKSNLIDRSHSEILKDVEASVSRFHKRFKIQSQTCEQVMDEAEKDFKKISEQINENCEAMKESYEELMADTEASTSRVCKTTIPELSKSYEKAIGLLQSRFGIPST
ncbi:uncharacterized protein [Euphorbia lathyris]|uniref:uncharacterized protein n=1 Tax=Euphorbia lathyris TaxID=212925 RepID=UPI0033142D76